MIDKLAISVPDAGIRVRAGQPYEVMIEVQGLIDEGYRPDQIEWVYPELADRWYLYRDGCYYMQLDAGTDAEETARLIQSIYPESKFELTKEVLA